MRKLLDSPWHSLSIPFALKLKFSTMACHGGGTWDLDQDDFLLRVFFLIFMGIGPCGLVPFPLEWTSFPPLVTALLITLIFAESPGSRRMGVIGALVLILPSETGQNFLSLAGPVQH